ncbi:MAG: hypothetical protein ACJAU1_001255, partial [Psychromonas sp.]
VLPEGDIYKVSGQGVAGGTIEGDNIMQLRELCLPAY